MEDSNNVVTTKDFSDFLVSVGADQDRDCPVCNKESEFSARDFANNTGNVAEITPQEIESFKNGNDVYFVRISCGNCGYIEHYNLTPLLKKRYQNG